MAPTHLPQGITNVVAYGAMGSFVAPFPGRLHTYFNDFDLYTATDWTVTETDAGATQAVASGNNGLLVLTNSAADDDINAIRLANTSFVVSSERSFWIGARLSTDVVVESDILVGLVNVMTGFNPGYGVYLEKVDDTATFALVIEENGTRTVAANLSPAIVADTMVDLAIAYDETSGAIIAYMNDAPFAQITTFTNLPTAALAPAVGVRNGDAAAVTLTVDYLFASSERV